MLDQNSLEIGRRLVATLRLIESGTYSTPLLAEKVGVSIPTISRRVTALRVRGYDIHSLRGTDGWFYMLKTEHTAAQERQEPERFRAGKVK